MPATIKVLEQAYPTATVETTLYICGATSAVVSSLMVANTSGTPDTITVRVCIGGAADNNKQLLFSGTPIGPNGAINLTAGLTLANTDVVKVTSTNGTCAFQLFGQENS
jgi:hypothetical protein